MAKIKIQNITGFATTLEGKSNNSRIRNQALHGAGKFSIYPDSWKYIDALLGKTDGQEGAVVNTIKLAPDTISLLQSMAEEGQLHPIYVNADKELVDGFGRVEVAAFAHAVREIGEDKLQACLEMAKTQHNEEEDADWSETVYTWAQGVGDTLDCVVTDKEPHKLSMEANIRRKDVNPLDFGYWLKLRLDNGETRAQVARDVWPAAPLHISMATLDEYVKLTTCDVKVQSALRAGTKSMKSALSTLDPKGKDGETVKPPTYAVSAKALHSALLKAEAGDFAGLNKIFGEEKIAATKDTIIPLLRCICYIPKPKPKAAPKPKKKTKAELESESAKLKEKLAALSEKTGVSIDELFEEEEAPEPVGAES